MGSYMRDDELATALAILSSHHSNTRRSAPSDDKFAQFLGIELYDDDQWFNDVLETSMRIRTPPSGDAEPSSSATPPIDESAGTSYDLDVATELQRQFDERNAQLRGKLAGASISIPSTPPIAIPDEQYSPTLMQLQFEDEDDVVLWRRLGELSIPPAPPDDDPDDDPGKLSDIELARRLQEQFDEENDRLRREHEELQREIPSMFECGVCFDETSEEEVAIVEPCGHQFCRECVKSHAVSKIDEHRYPIPCPTCMTGAAQEDTGVINDALIQQLGISERHYAIFVEMQMAAFSLKVRCRKCENEFFVDKAEYEAADTVRCPLGCNFTWCKACSQAIDTEPGAAAHSCDGENELKHLMGEKGWKNCPGCSTPSEKISGCNHMTCPAPGCNVHFCYHCGEQIIRSTTQEEISNALGAHYARCALWIEGQDA